MDSKLGNLAVRNLPVQFIDKFFANLLCKIPSSIPLLPHAAEILDLV